MSRIADVLKKAKEENAAWKEPRASAGTPALDPRSIADVKVPWSLTDTLPARPQPPPLQLAPPIPAASISRNVENRPAEVPEDPAVASLVRAVFFAGASSANRRVLFTAVGDSPSAGDLVNQIGRTLARQTELPVYLVDMDVANPSLHKKFDLAGRVGFSDALAQVGALSRFAHQDKSEINLWVVPAGSHTETPGLGEATTQFRIRSLLESAHYVVAYTAAIGRYSDAELLGRLFDGVVLVAQTGSTPPEALRRAANALNAAKARLVGTILE